jgi:hypothetical protein
VTSSLGGFGDVRYASMSAGRRESTGKWEGGKGTRGRMDVAVETEEEPWMARYTEGDRRQEGAQLVDGAKPVQVQDAGGQRSVQVVIVGEKAVSYFL